VRSNLALVCVPLLLVVGEKAIRPLLPELFGDLSPLEMFLAGLAVPLTVFAVMPWVLRLVLGLKPLGPGPLRDRLLAASRRLRFRFSNVLVWNTRNNVANAMVTGVLPLPRYVVLTDRLMRELSPEEIEAVFGHEVGHIKHGHILYYFGFLLISLTAVWAVLAAFAPELDAWLDLGDRADLAVLPAVAVVGVYIFVVFGFLSRRCERQADIFGCRTVSCPQADCPGHEPATALAPRGRGLCPTGIRTFIEALEKVARLNGISRDRPGWLQSWQHSTIARRVEFLQRIVEDPALERRFQRTVGLVKWGLLLGLGGLLFFLCLYFGWEKLLV
jgi:Zn-dependent protease with chaperone function